MAMFKLNPMWSGDASLCVVAGSYVFQNTAAAPINTVVPSVLFRATANAGGAAIGQNETVAPQGSKVPLVINPTSAYAPGVATNGNANIALLDLRAYPADIVSVVANMVAAPSATPGQINLSYIDVAVLGIDQTNNFVYFCAVGGNGTPLPMQGGMALHFSVYFKDGFSP